MLRLLLILICTALLPACQRPAMVVPVMFAGQIDPLADVPLSEQQHTHTVFFATDRRHVPEASYGDQYNRLRSDRLELGTMKIDFGAEDAWPAITAATRDQPEGKRLRPKIADLNRLGQLGRPKFIQPDAPDTGDADATPSATAVEFIRQLNAAVKRSPQKEVTVYVHGFNNSFREAALTSAELDLYTGGLGPFVVYTWPSYDSLWEYSHDRDSVRYTSAHARRFVELLADEINAGRLDATKINFVGHSSGCEVIGSVLREIALISRDLTPQQRSDKWHIGTVILIAADISTDVARERLLKEDIRGLHDEIVVYSSRRDKALRWASRILYRTPRIGTIRESDLADADRRWLSRVSDVALVNIDDQPNHDPVNHSHHRFSPATLSDLILCLRSDLKPAERGLYREEGNVIWRFPDDYKERVNEAALRVYGKPSAE